MKKFAFNSLWILIEKACKIILYFFIGILLARYLGPNDFGNYSLIITILSICSGIAAFGLNGLLSKEFISNHNKYEVFHSSLIARLIGVSIAFIISILSFFIIFNEDIPIFIILLVSSAVSLSLVQIIDFYFESRLQSSISAKYKVAGYIIGALIKVSFLLLEYDYISIVIAHIIELSTIFILGFMTLKSKTNTKKLFTNHINKVYIIELLLKGWPLLLSGIAVILYMKIDQFFIFKYLDSTHVGLYSAATRLCEGLFLFSAIVIPSFFPSLIKFKKENNLDKYYEYIKKLFYSLFIIGIIMCSFIIFFSQEIISLLYGEKYINSYLVLAIFSISLPIIYVGDILSRWLIIEDLVKYSMIRHSLGLGVNILLNIMLIPKYGIEGAAIASVFAYIFSVFIFILLVKKTRPFLKIILNLQKENHD